MKKPSTEELDSLLDITRSLQLKMEYLQQVENNMSAFREFVLNEKRLKLRDSGIFSDHKCNIRLDINIPNLLDRTSFLFDIEDGTELLDYALLMIAEKHHKLALEVDILKKMFEEEIKKHAT